MRVRAWAIAYRQVKCAATFAPETVEAELARSKRRWRSRSSARGGVGNADRARTLENTGALSAQQIQQFFTAAKTARSAAECGPMRQPKPVPVRVTPH